MFEKNVSTLWWEAYLNNPEFYPPNISRQQLEELSTTITSQRRFWMVVVKRNRPYDHIMFPRVVEEFNPDRFTEILNGIRDMVMEAIDEDE